MNVPSPLVRALALLLLMGGFTNPSRNVSLAAPPSSSANVFIDGEQALARLWGENWRNHSSDEIRHALEQLAESLPVGGAIDLPRSVPCGTLDFRRVADRVQVTGGRDGTIVFGGGQAGLELLFSELDQEILPGVARPPHKRDPARVDHLLAAREFHDLQIMGTAAPATDFFGMFNKGGIKIKNDVKNCAWIAGENAFGDHVVTADARVDDSLFLWFGINWPFRDYNQHWNPKHAGRDWNKTNAQMHLNLHGGGQGTRLYEMIETSYGNPGSTAVFENCEGLACYHGSTERGSSQGPGVYYLKNCRHMQLGLRGINAFGGNDGDPRNADAARDITIEGGEGNVLYMMRTWSNSNEVSLWNSDPKLQLWGICSQYGHRGTENLFRFAVTPYYGRPTAENLAKLNLPELAQQIVARRERKMKTDGSMRDVPNPEPVERLIEKLKTGRHMDAPFNAQDEETLKVGKVDLTEGKASGVKVPVPPQIPPTSAPRTRRPLAFTQGDSFGKELLRLGADPTGKKPSDDAFAQLLYGMTRDELQALIDDSRHATESLVKIRDERDAKVRAIPKEKSDERKAVSVEFDSKLQPLKERIQANVKKVWAKTGVPGKGAKNTVRIEIPPGTFYLKRPLYIFVTNEGLFGAGPEKTILTTDQPIQVIKIQHPTNIGNFSVVGGSVGLALTGSDHEDNESPLFHSYIAGQNFYNITFRDQSHAGMVVGVDEEGIRGGSEHDQNKYVDLKFLNTGNYGIYFSVGMLDKWLCLHGEFVGQKKAGIACQFNNLIHGCIIESNFTNIDGPAVDFFGGNCEIGFRPWEVWIDGCQFTECGNAKKFAVEQGIVELGAITHSKIVTKKKQIAGGYAGSPQVCQDNVIDVNLIPGGPAMKLRSVRTISVSRSNGHVIKNVSANGPLVFVNDAEQHGDLFEKTAAWLRAHGRPVVSKWDTNPMAHELAPRNGWVHPFLIYRSEIDGRKYDYQLLNVDVDAGRVVRSVDLTGE